MAMVPETGKSAPHCGVMANANRTLSEERLAGHVGAREALLSVAHRCLMQRAQLAPYGKRSFTYAGDKRQYACDRSHLSTLHAEIGSGVAQALWT